MISKIAANIILIKKCHLVRVRGGGIFLKNVAPIFRQKPGPDFLGQKIKPTTKRLTPIGRRKNKAPAVKIEPIIPDSWAMKIEMAI
jgi:hypothetical protein